MNNDWRNIEENGRKTVPFKENGAIQRTKENGAIQRKTVPFMEGKRCHSKENGAIHGKRCHSWKTVPFMENGAIHS